MLPRKVDLRKIMIEIALEHRGEKTNAWELICSKIRLHHPELSDEQVEQQARTGRALYREILVVEDPSLPYCYYDGFRDGKLEPRYLYSTLGRVIGNLDGAIGQSTKAVANQEWGMLNVLTSLENAQSSAKTAIVVAEKHEAREKEHEARQEEYAASEKEREAKEKELEEREARVAAREAWLLAAGAK